MRGWRRIGRVPVLLVALALLVVIGAVAVALTHGLGSAVAVRTVALDAYPGQFIPDPSGGHAFIVTYTSDPQTHAMEMQAVAAGMHMSVLNLRTDRLAGTVDLGTAPEPQSTLVDARRGRLAVAGFDRVVLVDTQRSRVVTTVMLGPSLNAIALDERRGRIYASWSDNGSGLGILTTLDTRTGAVLRRATIGDSQNLAAEVNVSSPAVDAATGRVFLPFTTTTYGVAARTNSVVIRAMTDSVAMFDSAGRLLNTTALGHFSSRGESSLDLAVDPLHGRVVVLDGNTGDVSTLDARSGRLVRVLHLGRGSATGTAMFMPPFGSWGLDPQTGRAFIATLATMQRVVCPAPRANSRALNCISIGSPGACTCSTRTPAVCSDACCRRATPAT